jgi:hypothetical protein
VRHEEAAVDQDTSTTEQGLLEELRRRRGELRESMSALEQALAAPPAGGLEAWAGRVEAALVELSGDLREHVAITEGPEGLYAELMAQAPRLTGEMERLTQEHAQVREAIEELLTKVEAPDVEEHRDGVRDLGTRLLATLFRHRQRGADLVYEAYEFDIGGDT